MRCLDCEHLKLKDCPMATHGFGNCRYEPVHRYMSVSIEHDCNRFDLAREEIRAERNKWFEKRLEGRKK